MSVPTLTDGPDGAPLTLILAHGAGAPMDSPFMDRIAEGVAAAGWRVVRFEFPYMAARRATGAKKPPDREPVLTGTWRSVIADLGADTLVIGGKSLGGRMASMIADEAGVRGLVCLGYPFHPPGRPDRLRTAHLETLATPALILQGERDPLGRADEVPCYTLSETISLAWLPDGDHSFKPRKASGHTEESNLALAVERICGFLDALAA
ncbi:MAG: alpha/beta hydrolase [Rhodospirillaceae bacterium]|nr:alpha/beta hydrolase [Rhodospirillaceae bacterium]